jgi:hypothetical protein
LIKGKEKMEYITSIENKCKFCSWTAEMGNPMVVTKRDHKVYAFCPMCRYELEVSIVTPVKEYDFKRYKYDDWDVTDDIHMGMSWGERTYVDLNGNLITGILEGFYGYTDDASDEKNCQYVENGKRKKSPLVKQRRRP